MHEMQITKAIAGIVLEQAEKAGALKITSITLTVGEMRHWEQSWVQRYFDQCVEGTVAQGAEVILEVVPIIYECTECHEPFPMDVQSGEHTACPRCGCAEHELICGTELIIKEIEVA